jgi:hypothetical protein
MSAADSEGEVGSVFEAGVGQLEGTDNDPSETALPGPADATSIPLKSCHDFSGGGF